jgi:hypothetical protein
MIALMTLWFGPAAGLLPGTGYFYLCPSCYQARITPHIEEILHRLTEYHPVGRKDGSGRTGRGEEGFRAL